MHYPHSRFRFKQMTAEVHTTLFTHAHTHMLVRTKTRLSMHAPNSFVQFKRMHAAANTYTDALTHAHTHTHAACMLQIPIFSLCKCPQMHTHTLRHSHSYTHVHTHTHACCYMRLNNVEYATFSIKANVCEGTQTHTNTYTHAYTHAGFRTQIVPASVYVHAPE